jgi:ABC-type multidrug transport system ATPase subunit
MLIQAALVRIMRQRTVIAVAHRLSTLTGFDRILVIDQGRIVEDGSAAALRYAGGLFERMWRRQSQGLPADGPVRDETEAAEVTHPIPAGLIDAVTRTENLYSSRTRGALLRHPDGDARHHNPEMLPPPS